MRKKVYFAMILSIFLLIMFAFSIMGNGKVNAWDKTNGYKTYVNSKYHFSLDYPQEWISTSENPEYFGGATFEKYDFLSWRAIDPKGSSVVDVRKGSLKIAGVPCIVVIESVYDPSRDSLGTEMNKSGFSSSQVIKDQSLTINGISGSEVIYTFVNNNLGMIAKSDLGGRIYQGYGFVMNLLEENKMIYIVCVFDPSAYDEKFSRDIMNTLRRTLTSDKDILSFNFSTVIGEIAGTNILVTVPYGTNVSSLVPSIVLSGGTVDPASGVANNFMLPVNYVVTAEDKTTKVYTVMVIVAKNSAKDFISFGFLDLKEKGVIDNKALTIDVIVPEKTDMAKLVAVFDTTGTSVEVEKMEQKSGETANDFSKPVIYRVVAEDSSYQEYTITVREKGTGIIGLEEIRTEDNSF